MASLIIESPNALTPSTGKSTTPATSSSAINNNGETKTTSPTTTKASPTTTKASTFVLGSLPLHPDEIQKWGRPDSLTKAETITLAEFRSLVDPKELALRKMDHENDTTCLLRVLRADDFKIDLCKEAWDRSVAWHKKNQVWENLDRSAAEIVWNGKITTKQLCKKYPTGVKGVDRRGRPLSYKLSGIMDQSLFDDATLDDIIRWEVIVASMTVRHWLPKCSLDSGYHVENYVQIVDLAGMTVTSFGSNMRAALKGSIEVCGFNFPESMGATFVINSPWYFRTVWSIVRTFMAAETVAKTFVCGSTKELLKHIDPDM